jgi:hypothetical protein
MSALGTVENLRGQNLKNNHMINKKLGLIALLAGFAAGEMLAQNTLTNYTTGDVLICFRNGSTYNMVVDAGPISSFTNGVTPNQRIPITQYTTGQIGTAFGDAGGLDWSAFTWLGNNTLFVTKQRSSLNAQSTPWSSASIAAQQSTAQYMNAIPTGALYVYNNGAIDSTATSVIEPQAASGYTSGQSYNDALFEGGPSPTFGGFFDGDPEITTPGDFASSGTVVRSDFYQIPTGSGRANVIYLGYFEFAADGTMTYVAYPSTVPAIQSISRSGNVSTINYTTGLYGTYTLRGTNTLTSGTAPTNWPAINTLSSGDTLGHTYLDTDSSANKFYIITAQ